MSTSPLASDAVPQAARDFLVENGLAARDECPVWTPLTGGVSSELWQVRASSRDIVVKGALARLKVAGDWKAPTSRNAVEWDWLVYAHDVVPHAVPLPLAHDDRRGLFAMTFLAPDDHPVWKDLLLSGQVRPADSEAVGDLIGRLHAASAQDEAIPARFATDDNFQVLRIEPYLLATARKHPDLSRQLVEIAELTSATRRALVHGDVSPKNILIGPRGPVLLDAECAWYGDPAFDLAFVLTHLVLKSVVRPASRAALSESADSLVHAYQKHVRWEPPSDVLDRAGRLLPALLLARIDGKSPVEYFGPAEQGRVRDTARALLGGTSLDVKEAVRQADDLLSRR